MKLRHFTELGQLTRTSFIFRSALGLILLAAGCSDSSSGGAPAVVPDTDPPNIVSTVPVTGAIDVPVSTTISVTFDEDMDGATITGASVGLSNGGPVAGTVDYDLATRTATFAPSAALADRTIHTLVLTAAITDLAGNPLAGAPVTVLFATEDITRPTVDQRWPLPGATQVSPLTTVRALFDEPMDEQSVEALGVFSLASTNTVAAVVNYDPVTRIATLTPSAPLHAATSYTATIGTGCQDLSGNALASPVTWSFTVDSMAPTVIATSPTAGATGVPISPSITATFHEPLDPLTVTASSFVLEKIGGTAVAGVVGYDALTHTATFSPASPLLAQTGYTATLTPTITDVAGNPLAAAYSWSFLTGGSIDTTPPTVVAISPFDGQSAVGLATRAMIRFSEPMSIAATQAAISIQPQVPMLLTWDPAGDLVRIAFDTTAPPGIEWDDVLAEDTAYAVAIAGSATDLAGNPLAIPLTSTWTTWVDATPPRVATFVPDIGSTLSLPIARIEAHFDEPMNPSFAAVELWSANDHRNPRIEFYTPMPDNGMSLEWVSPTQLDLVLGAPLHLESEYEMWIGGIDLAGNPTSDRSEFFLVTAGTRSGAPSLVTSVPAHGQVDVPGESMVFLGFSRAMGADLENHISVAGAASSAFDLRRMADPHGVLITPLTAWTPGSVISVHVAGAAVDASGNPLGATQTVSFSIGPPMLGSWGVAAAHSTLKDGDVDLTPFSFRHTFRFVDAGGDRVILDPRVPPESISIVEQATGIPVSGYRVAVSDDILEIRSIAGGAALEPLTTYELSFGSGFVNAWGVPITPTTIAFTTAGANARPEFSWLLEPEDALTDSSGTRVEFWTAVADPDLDPLSLYGIDRVDPAFAPLFTQTFPGNFEYATPGANETAITTLRVTHPLALHLSDGTGLPGHAFSVDVDIFPFDPAFLPSVTAPSGAIPVPGGLPTYQFDIPVATRGVSQVLLLAVRDSLGRTALSTVLPVSATSFAHPADNPLPAGSYSVSFSALHFGPGLLRGTPNGEARGNSGAAVDFIVP